MALPPVEFSLATGPEPHRARTGAILKSHPEVRSLIGPNPWSFALVVGIVVIQTAIAAVLAGRPWWLALIAAYLIGAFATHASFVLIHECAHNLVFKSRTANILTGILADLTNVIPSAVFFSGYHLKHHAFQGDYTRDADLPSKWEARLIGSSVLGKAFWLMLFPVFQALRLPRLKAIISFNLWTLVNCVVVLGFDAFVIIALGHVAFLYIAASFAFAVGLHPLGARWIQEHYLTAPPQETYSYYGRMNLVALNVGYHNEHHDMPSIPWNRLPRLNEQAKEFYSGLVSYRSWSRLLWKFLTDGHLSLFSRMVRSNRRDVET